MMVCVLRGTRTRASGRGAILRPLSTLILGVNRRMEKYHKEKKTTWWPVVIAEESDVCHKGDRGPRVPLEGTTGREGKPWTTSRGFAVRMGRAPPAANGAEAI